MNPDRRRAESETWKPDDVMAKHKTGRTMDKQDSSSADGKQVEPETGKVAPQT